MDVESVQTLTKWFLLLLVMKLYGPVPFGIMWFLVFESTFKNFFWRVYNRSGTSQSPKYEETRESQLGDDNSQIEDLPSDLDEPLNTLFVNQSSVGWINDIISMFWKSCLSPQFSKDFIQEIINRLFKKIVVEEVSLGECPIKVTEISTSDTHDTMTFHVSILYPGDGVIAVKWRNSNCEGEMKNLGLAFGVKVVVGPLRDDFFPPGAISICFTEEPILMLEGEGIFNVPVDICMKIIQKYLMPLIDFLVVHPKNFVIQFPNKKKPASTCSIEGMMEISLKDGQKIQNEVGCLPIKTGGGKEKGYALFTLGQQWTKTKPMKALTMLDRFVNFSSRFVVTDQDDGFIKLEFWDEKKARVVYFGRIEIAREAGVQKQEVILTCYKNNETLGLLKVLTNFVPLAESKEKKKMAVIRILIKSVRTNRKIEPVVGVQISGQSSRATRSKGDLGHKQNYSEEFLMIVRDTKNDLLRISLYDSSDSLPQVLKYLNEKVSNVGYEEEETPEHRKKSLEKRDFGLIGAKIYPVRYFLNNPGKMENVDLGSDSYGSNMEVKIDFDVEMLLLENQDGLAY